VGATSTFCLMVQSEIIDPAVKGTLNVLRSCSKVPSIKRVIITSSMASVMFNGKPMTPDVVVDETWFSDPVICKEEKVCIHAIQ
jgi:nucleoside-diphosphate-sugar epimerase